MDAVDAVGCPYGSLALPCVYQQFPAVLEASRMLVTIYFALWSSVATPKAIQPTDSAAPPISVAVCMAIAVAPKMPKSAGKCSGTFQKHSDSHRSPQLTTDGRSRRFAGFAAERLNSPHDGITLGPWILQEFLADT